MSEVTACTGGIDGVGTFADHFARRERIDKWLNADPQPGEEMIWVGKNYSLAQAKRDIEAELEYQEESASFDYPQTDW